MDPKTLETIKKIKEGDRQLAKDFFNPLIRDLIPYTELFLSNEDDVMECVRQAVNDAHQNVDTAETAATVTDWIRSFVLQEVVKKISPIAIRRGSGHGVNLQKTCPEDLEECRKELLVQLEPLDPCERAAVVLNQYEHRSVQETADILHTDTEIVDTLLRHGRSRLDSLYLFELIQKLNPRVSTWDTLEIDQYLPKKQEKTDTYEFTTSIKSIEDTFLQETSSMKPIRSRPQRTYEDDEDTGNPIVNRILIIAVIAALIALILFILKVLR